MTTFTMGGMLDQIASDMGRPSTAFRTAATNAISQAIRRYQPERFYFNEGSSLFATTAADTGTYNFGSILSPNPVGAPAEFFKIDLITIAISSTDIRDLEIVNYADFQAYWDENTTHGQPSQAAFRGRGNAAALVSGVLQIWPRPDGIYTITLYGHLRVAPPASEAEDNNYWMVDGYDLIMSRAKAELYMHRLEDPNNAALMAQAEKSALKALKDATADKVRTGYVQATDF